ncbi:MAG TPA: hypothetical protein VI612_05325 [Candidatus Nanoarchaeia archaeon]|nr:hypothetical protein [Candidatus Nanoarchaeia archaeon]
MRLFHLFEIIAVLALVLFLFASAEGGSGESRQCFFVGYCEFDENGVGYRYYQCTGAFAGYSNWRVDNRCQMPGWKPRIPLESVP